MPTNLQTDLERLNLLPTSEAENELLKCCGSRAWAAQLIAERPFDSVDDLIKKADRIWWSLEPPDWLEAFHSHPKIGEQKAASAVAVEAQRWSENEQSGVRNSAAATLAALAKLNRAYEEKFGYIFIVCASGKSSEEMLAILRARLENPAAQELRNAATEQAKITKLRLGKLLAVSHS
jgi:OHCU decarboxylase